MAVTKNGGTMKETNNYPQGKSGGKVKTMSGPAKGHASGNRIKGGGITEATRGKLAG